MADGFQKPKRRPTLSKKAEEQLALEVLQKLLPTRNAQLAYHAALEEALGIKISRICGKWTWWRPKKPSSPSDAGKK